MKNIQKIAAIAVTVITLSACGNNSSTSTPASQTNGSTVPALSAEASANAETTAAAKESTTTSATSESTTTSAEENAPTNTEIEAFKKAIVKYEYKDGDICWEPVPGAEGYEVLGAIGEGVYTYSVNADTKETSIEAKQLDCVKKMYNGETDTVKITVRAYMVVNGENVYTELNAEVIVLRTN